MSKFCTSCGTKLEDNVKFCTSCGKAVEGEESNNKPANNSQPVNNNVVVNNNQQQKNGLAIAGFVVSLVSTLLCCGAFNLVGLILSIVGLVKAKDYNGNGKGLAIAGIIISAICILILVLYVIFLIMWPNIASSIEEDWNIASEIFIVR